MEAAVQTVSDGNSAPASFESAFAAEASSAPDSSTQSSTPAGAEAPPTETSEATPAGQAREPFIPRERFDEVNGKYNELKAWKEQYGWAEQADRTLIEQAVRLGQLYQQDKAGFVRELISDNPDPALVSEFARVLQGRRGQTQPAAVDLNPIQIEMADGRTMPFYTAEQVQHLAQQAIAQKAAELEQKLAPAMSAAQKLQIAEVEAQATQFATSFVSKMAQHPGFEEHKAEIGQEVKRMLEGIPMSDPRRQAPGFLEAATYEAYVKVAVPKLSQKAQSDTLDSLQRKAAASIAPNPGGAAPSTAREVRSFTDPSLSWG